MEILAPGDGAIDSGSHIGFFGKIPSRGDFVRAGLPGSFVSVWDAWLQAVLPASKLALGDGWVSAWMEAPIWHFLLQPGACGPNAAMGVFMPSVDRAGRYFPLTLACVASDAAALIARRGWLAVAEATGVAALETDITPDLIAARLMAAPANQGGSVPDGRCAWWTEGAPLVPATTFATATLPNATVFTRMLDATTTASDADSGK